MFKLLTTVLLLGALVLGLLLSDRPKPRADFVYCERTEPSTLDLQQMTWMHELRLANALWEGLVETDVFSWDYAKKPGVALSWEVSADERTYTFHLRPDAKWSNGQTVEAGDFIYAWRRGMLPETGADYIGMYQLVRGAKAFFDWRQAQLEAFAKGSSAGDRAAAWALWDEAVGQWGRGATREFAPGKGGKFEEMVGLRAPDARTLIVELERPLPYFLEIVAYEVLGPVFPPLLERFTSIDPKTGQSTADPRYLHPENWVSNGPFIVTDYRFRREIRLERNAHYWDAKSINVDSISLPAMRDANAAVLGRQTGSFDWLTDVLPDYRGDMIADKRAFYAEHKEQYEALLAQGLDPVAIDRRLPRDPRKNIHAFPAFGTYFYNFNCLPRLPDGRVNPFADARVRRAFAMTVDKGNIVENVRRLGERPTATLIPPETIDRYVSPKGLDSAPKAGVVAAARALLAEAGYPGGRGFPTVKILYNVDGGHEKIAEAVKRDWELALEVRVELDRRQLNQFRTDLRNTNYMISRGSWFGDYGDPTTFLELNRSTDGNNDRKFNDPKYDKMLDDAANERDPARRYAMLAEAERYTVEEAMPLIPIFQYNQVYLFDPDVVSGVSPHPRQKQSIYRIDMLGDGKGADRPLEMPVRPKKAPPEKPPVKQIGRACGAMGSVAC